MFTDPEGLLQWTGYVFESERHAVADAVRKAHSNWNSWFNEYGGIVYKKCDMFAYDFKFISGRTGFIYEDSRIIADGGKAIAGWHTHPRWNKVEGIYFSKDDMKFYLPLWLGTPSGNLRYRP